MEMTGMARHGVASDGKAGKAGKARQVTAGK